MADAAVTARRPASKADARAIPLHHRPEPQVADAPSELIEPEKPMR